MGTTLYSHTGTHQPTDIGPHSGGALHSITILEAGPNDTGSLIVRDGGRKGKVILQLNYIANHFPLPRLEWDGYMLNGQLNVTLSHRKQKVSIEMWDLFHENPSPILSADPEKDGDFSSDSSDDFE